MSQASGDWLARFHAGENEAFDHLVAEMGPRLQGYFLRQGANLATAEDLTQNVFLRAYQQSSRYQPEGRLDAFFLRIARNLWIDHRRRRGPAGPEGGLETAAQEGPGPAERAAASDLGERLRRGLAELDSDGREILELAVLQQLPYRDVADLLEIPVGTVKSRVFYALRRLRRRLEESGLDPAQVLDEELGE